MSSSNEASYAIIVIMARSAGRKIRIVNISPRWPFYLLVYKYIPLASWLKTQRKASNINLYDTMAYFVCVLTYQLIYCFVVSHLLTSLCRALISICHFTCGIQVNDNSCGLVCIYGGQFKLSQSQRQAAVEMLISCPQRQYRRSAQQ